MGKHIAWPCPKFKNTSTKTSKAHIAFCQFTHYAICDFRGNYMLELYFDNLQFLSAHISVHRVSRQLCSVKKHYKLIVLHLLSSKQQTYS